jgi:hypothetical protein
VNQVMVTLACAHTRRFPYATAPTVGDSAVCRFDGDQTVTVVWCQESHGKCGQCPYAYLTGQDRRQAYARRNAHRRNRGHDSIEVVYDDVTRDGKGTAFVKTAVPKPLAGWEPSAIMGASWGNAPLF